MTGLRIAVARGTLFNDTLDLLDRRFLIPHITITRNRSLPQKAVKHYA